MCRAERVKLLDTYQFSDSPDDEFEREPYCVKFSFHDDTGESWRSLLPVYCNITAIFLMHTNIQHETYNILYFS